MPNPYFKAPKKLVREWPEVFEDMYITNIPLEYLDHVHLEFSNGRIWKIDVREQLAGSTTDDVIIKVRSTISEYYKEIKKIDYKVDIERLKSDIQSSTQRIMSLHCS